MNINALRNHGVALLVVLGLGLGGPKPAHAFYCANCGTEWTQLANNLQLVKQLEQQILSVQQQLKQYENMLLNSGRTSTERFGAVDNAPHYGNILAL